MSGTSVKLSLKIMVDKKNNRVVFAEAGKDFVDFLFHILSLPLYTVVQHLKDKGLGGCLGSLYTSYSFLGDEYLQPKIDQAFNPSVDVIVPKLSLIAKPHQPIIYKCPSRPESHQQCTSQSYLTCPMNGCRNLMNESVGRYVSVSSSYENPGYVKEAASYMVTDDLGVTPMTISALKYRLNDFSNLEEEVVQVGNKEGIEILKASLETKAVLTTVFLGKDN